MSRRRHKSRVKRRAAASRISWDEAHKHLSHHIPCSRLSAITADRLLTVESEFIKGAAHWRKISGIWSCIGAGQPLKWMIGQTPAKVHLELLRLWVDYSWKGLSGRLCGSIHGCRCSAPASSTIDAAVRPTSGHSGLGVAASVTGNPDNHHGTPPEQRL